MFEIFKSKPSKEDSRVIKYSINEEGLRYLKRSLSIYKWSDYSNTDISQFDADLAFLSGIAVTIPDNQRMSNIITKMETLKHALHASLSITEEYIDERVIINEKT